MPPAKTRGRPKPGQSKELFAVKQSDGLRNTLCVTEIEIMQREIFLCLCLISIGWRNYMHTIDSWLCCGLSILSIKNKKVHFSEYALIYTLEQQPKEF